MIEPWTVLSSEMALDHRWYKVRRDTVRLPGDKIIDDYFVSVRPDVSIVVPIDAEGRMVLVRQYKHGAQQVTLEFPAGTFRDEAADAAAVRELAEETGYVAGELAQLGVWFDDASKNTNRVHAFIALGCRATGRQQLDELEAASGLEVVTMSIDEVAEALGNGAIASMSSVAAGYRALQLLSRPA